ncbi:FAD/NAD(P)-binding domain-containing protein [Durotheca rogersii]|uniref:FAD/NAD(P)-binding domain-containing protein n=1 Tax=Durotheca rogersii TaxID=419775 RepID=UPI00221E8686|nr:FAD/NAD(P)-binding domain-containing protein [Durotheca rogersii]KAI5861555.1 FAD/NAD(P)-binding domain-containing protein [Durotheca rogersii]
MPPGSPPKVWEKIERDASSKLNVIIVGAGLGGLGAAISILLAGHDVTVLEAAAEIGEIGAGIQVLPNSSRVLISWGLEEAVAKHATMPRYTNMFGWKGNLLSRMDLHAYADALGTPFWDFHRANLHRCLLDRAVELGAEIHVNARVTTVECAADGLTATAALADGRALAADLVVGADGISSRLREVLLGRADPPQPTGDLAYRLLIPAGEMRADAELRRLVEDPQVNYWIGPDAHAVNYVLRGGELFNMVLLVPDDLPAAAMTAAGDVAEMRARFAAWDPRIAKVLALCRAVQKWKLCIRPTLERWSHESGAFTLLGDAVHATLPYLASGCGMALEDAAALGLCLAKVRGRGRAEKQQALRAYEGCRKARTERVVERGNRQQHLYHVHDGAEQRERDRRLRMFADVDEALLRDPGHVARPRPDPGDGDGDGGGDDDPLPWRYYGVGGWLLAYDLEREVEASWARVQDEAEAKARPSLKLRLEGAGEGAEEEEGAPRKCLSAYLRRH